MVFYNVPLPNTKHNTVHLYYSWEFIIDVLAGHKPLPREGTAIDVTNQLIGLQDIPLKPVAQRRNLF